MAGKKGMFPIPLPVIITEKAEEDNLDDLQPAIDEIKEDLDAIKDQDERKYEETKFHEKGVLGTLLKMLFIAKKDQVLEKVKKWNEKISQFSFKGIVQSKYFEKSLQFLKNISSQLGNWIIDLIKGLLFFAIFDPQGVLLSSLIELFANLIIWLIQALAVIIPRIIPIILTIVPTLIKAIAMILPEIIKLIPIIIDTIVKLVPLLIQSVIKLLPELLKAGLAIITTILDNLEAHFPFLRPLITTLKGFAAVIENLIPSGQGLTNVLGFLPEVFQFLKTILMELQPLFQELAVAVFEVLKVLFNVLKEILPVILTLGFLLLKLLLPQIKLFAAMLTYVWLPIIKLLLKLLLPLIKLLLNIVNLIVFIVQGIYNFFVDAFIDAAKNATGIGDFFNRLLENILLKPILKLAEIFPQVDHYAKLIEEFITSFIDQSVAAVMSFMQKNKDIVIMILKIIFFIPLLYYRTTLLMISLVKKALLKMADWIMTGVEFLGDWIYGIFQGLARRVDAALTKLKNSPVVIMITDLLEMIKETFKWITEKFEKVLGSSVISFIQGKITTKTGLDVLKAKGVQVMDFETIAKQFRENQQLQDILRAGVEFKTSQGSPYKIPYSEKQVKGFTGRDVEGLLKQQFDMSKDSNKKLIDILQKILSQGRRSGANVILTKTSEAFA